jgi:deoxyribonuclease-4
MPVRLGPAGVPLSCKGRTVVEGIDDIIALGLDTMELQTVRMVAPQHFEQYWQAGVLADKAEFEMNIHGPYYAELLGDKLQRTRTLAKYEAALQAGKTINARHITCHVGGYGEYERGNDANEQVANVFAGIVERAKELWEDEVEYPVFPWLADGTPMKVGIETSGSQSLWGSLEEVLEVVNHVEGTIPVLNIAHIHSRGHGCMRTSEDYGEMFDLVRTSLGTKTFYCHFSGISHRTGNALHYTQIKKSDLNFEPLAEFLIEDGDWLDVTIISDSPLLEHDAMYMYQQLEKSRHRQLERKALEERRRVLAASAGLSEEELAAREKEQQLAGKAVQEAASKAALDAATAKKEATQDAEKKSEKPKSKAKKTSAKPANGKKAAADDSAGTDGLFDDSADKDEDIF